MVTKIEKAGNVTEHTVCTIVTATQLQGCTPTTLVGVAGPLWTVMAGNSKASVSVNGVTYDQNLVETIAAGGIAAKSFTITGGILLTRRRRPGA